jgi:hypothetical protein
VRFVFLLAALFASIPAQAQRVYDQAELDALVAPIALQTDGVVSQILIAATYPEEVAAAAGWSRSNPHLRGDDAVRAVQNEPWDPSVKSLVAFPELLARMDESPQWTRDLGAAFLSQEAQVMATVQALRRRAQAAGQLSNTGQTVVTQEGEAILVQPRTQVVYVPYYDPYVVYGSWWWPAYRPVYWRPWVARPVVVHGGFFYAKPVWHHHKVHVVHKPVHAGHHHAHVVPGKWQHRGQHGTAVKTVQKPYFTTPALVPQSKPMPETQTVRAPRPQVRVPSTQGRPIAQQMPAANGFSNRARPPDPRRASPPQAQRQNRAQEQRGRRG